MMMHARRRCLAVILHVWLLGVCATLVAQPTPVAGNEEHQRGIELYRQGNYEAAAGHFQSLLKKNSADNLSSYYLGLSLEKQDKLKEATKALENALKRNPNFALARSALSYVHLRRNKNSQALQEAERALTIVPTLAEAHYVVGIVRFRSDHPQLAFEAANEAIKFAPEMPAPHLLRSLAIVSLYTIKLMGDFNPRVLPANSPPPLTPEERERRRQNRVKAARSFNDAAGSLETYLRLQPPDSSTEMWLEQLETLQFYGTQMDQNREKTPAAERLWFSDEITTKVRVLTKPEPNYTNEARNAGVKGRVILRAVFAADGTVRHILVLNGLPNGLTEQAVKAARRIKFEPATVNSVPVSTVVQLEYNFNFY